MKNHIRVNGQLLQTNKKWGALKRSQQTWIIELAKERYRQFVNERKKLPVNGSKIKLIWQIHDEIRERGIWIPFDEVERKLNVLIARWNRRAQAAEEASRGEQIPMNTDDAEV